MRWIFKGDRSRKWPNVDLYMAGGRGDIKTLSKPELERLMAAAGESGWSAVGRPAWLRAHRDRIRSLLLVVFGVEGATVYRCLVTAILDDGSGGSFTLDVSFEDFNGLPDVAPKDLTKLAHLYLAQFPPLELDPAQQEAWERPEHPE